MQLDHAIIHKDWRNITHDIHTITGAALNSNHYLVKVDLQVRTKESKRTPPKPRHTRTPTTEQKQQYNTHIQKQLDPASSTDDYSHSSSQLPLQPTPHSQWNILQHAAQDAISEHIPTTTSSPKHPWITQATWKLIQQRSDARLSQRLELKAQLHKDIRKQARKDKTQRLKARLAESEATLDPRQKWKWIKRIRSDHKPRPVSIRDSQGKPTSQSQQAQVFAEYLRDSHWAAPPTPYTGPTDPIHPALSSSWRTTKHPAPTSYQHKPGNGSTNTTKRLYSESSTNPYSQPPSPTTGTKQSWSRFTRAKVPSPIQPATALFPYFLQRSFTPDSRTLWMINCGRPNTGLEQHALLPSLFTSSAALLKEQKRLDSRYTPFSSIGLRRSTKYTLTLFSQHWTASGSQHISPHSSRTYTLHRSSRSLPQENLAPAKKHKQASAKAVHSHHTSSSSFTA